MAYKLNGKSYTEHALMDEVIYNAKLIIDKIVLKNTRLAAQYETEETMLQADYLIAINNGSIGINFFPFTEDMLLDFGYAPSKVKDIMVDWHEIPVEDRDTLLDFCCKRFMEDYVEKNAYYRSLMGLPEHGTDMYNIYIDPNNPKLIEDDANTDFNFSAPLHEYTTKDINTLEALGIMDDIRAEHTGPHYRYLNHIGTRKIDIVKARTALQWEILYIPDVEFLVKSRFKEVYAINRSIYLRRTYQEAYVYGSDYFDEAVMIMVLCQTLTDLISELPEWYIRRDIFDLRSVKYFLDSQGVEFYKEIPLKYQVKIVKNLNRLIRFKSTTKDIFNILEIFRAEGTTVYKYYLFKKFLYNRGLKEDEPPVLPGPWKMSDFSSYDYGDEDSFEGVWDKSSLERIDDFMCEETDNIDHRGEYRLYDFGDEDADEIPTTEESDYRENAKERDRVVYDENGNVYQLQFVRVPIDGSYDDYIKDAIYREEYDTVTTQDKYWDGEDTHYLVRNKHLEKDFTIEGTKYMFLDYAVSAKEYYYQMCYFMGLIFSSRIDTDDIEIAIPSINTGVDFSITDICIFLMCLSNQYLGLGLDIKTPPNVKLEKKHSFYKYKWYDGGWFYDGAGEDAYIPPEEEHHWMLDRYDFGYEDEDNIKYDEIYGTMYDFGYHNTIDYTKEVLVYDFNETTETSVELKPAPKKGVDIAWDESGGRMTIHGSEEAIRDWLSHSGYIPQDEWSLGNLYDFGQEGKGSGFYDFGDENEIPGVWETKGWNVFSFGDEDNDDPHAEEVVLDFGEEEADNIHHVDLFTETLSAPNNSVGDFINYDFYDETENIEPMPVYYHHRMYDFNLGDPDYEPVPRPEPNQSYPWWREEGVISHKYELYLDGLYAKKDETEPTKAIQGGNGVRYTEITHDTFYNWMSTDNPQLFVPLAGRILGFNLTVDIEEVKRNIGLRHSEFEFQHGYTLEDFGCENFVTTKKVSDIEELIKIYQINSECYKNLSNCIENDNNSRDKVVTMNYLFNSLFTVPFDTSFYRLKSGIIASSYEEILKERNLVLYKYYKEIMKESDPEARKDMMRDIMNQIVTILEYYVCTDDLRFAFSWIPTNSLEAITKYIQLLINFFKSWKVYFLDPHVTIKIDDKKENRVGVGDQIVETRIKQWVGDSLRPTDGVSIQVHRHITEEIYAGNKEVVDIMAYYQPDVSQSNIYDGRYVTLTDEEIENMTVADGGTSSILGSVPYNRADGGNVTARDEIYELNGGTPDNMQFYLTVDGGTVSTRLYKGDGKDYSYDVDGGRVSSSLTASESVSSFINDMNELVNHLILSTKRFNNLEIREDGIYLGDTFVTAEGIDRFVQQMENERLGYIERIQALIDQAKDVPSMDTVNQRIVDGFIKIFEKALAVVAEQKDQDIKNQMKNYTDGRINDLITWFNNTMPFEDWEFKKEEVVEPWVLS